MTEELLRQRVQLYRPFGLPAYELSIERVRSGKTWTLEGDLLSAMGQALLLGAMMYSGVAKVYGVLLLPPDKHPPLWWTFEDWQQPEAYRLRVRNWAKDKLFVQISCAEAVQTSMCDRLEEEAELEKMADWSSADYLWWLYGLHQECCLLTAVQSLLPLVSRPEVGEPPQLDELQLYYTDLSCLRLTTDGPMVLEASRRQVAQLGAKKGDWPVFRDVQVHETVGRA